MIRKLLRSSRRIVYIRISSERVCMQSNDGLHWEASPHVGIKTQGNSKVIAVIKDGASYHNSAGVSLWANPFGHPRTLISDFTLAEKLLSQGLRTMLRNMGGFFITAPALAIIHPLEKTEGGLTEVEQRAFKELGLSVGFRESLVYTGPELAITGMSMKSVERTLQGIPA